MSRGSGRKNLPREPEVTPDSGEGKEIGLSARQDPSGSPIPGLTGNVVNYETVRRGVPAGEPLEEFRGMMAHGVPPGTSTTEERALVEREGTLAQHRPPRPPELAGPRPAIPAVPVYLVTPNEAGHPTGTIATREITVPAAGADPVRVASRDQDRTEMLVLVETAAGSVSNVLEASPPTVPATGVAAQNTSQFPVSVAIAANGATISNVAVNGVSVGTAAGTYVVPAYGSISVSYTVATPTWTWTQLNVPSAAPSGIRVSRDIATLSAGAGALLRAGMASYQKLGNQQDELFAVSNDGSACTISVIYLYGETAA